MIPLSARILLLGACIFGIGASLVFLGMARGSLVMLGAGISGISLAALTLLLGSRLARRGPDRLESRREQRLWRSGPLGRSWLQRRKRLR